MRETGARKGLIGKSGVIPARSRHCNGEQPQGYATETNVLGRFERAMIQSQENCLSGNHRLTHERWEGDLYKSCVHLFPAIFIAGIFNGNAHDLRHLSDLPHREVFIIFRLPAAAARRG